MVNKKKPLFSGPCENPAAASLPQTLECLRLKKAFFVDNSYSFFTHGICL